MKVYIVKAEQNTKHLSPMLFPIVFEKETGKHVRYEDLARDELGKPQPIDGIHFNISHSGNYWCIVFSDSECGIDIENNRKLDKYMERKILYPGEEIMDGNLIRNWVLKEAYAKKIGVGIGIGSGVATFDPEEIRKECVISNLCTDNYICYAVGDEPVTEVAIFDIDRLR